MVKELIAEVCQYYLFYYVFNQYKAFYYLKLISCFDLKNG